MVDELNNELQNNFNDEPEDIFAEVEKDEENNALSNANFNQSMVDNNQPSNINNDLASAIPEGNSNGFNEINNNVEVNSLPQSGDLANNVNTAVNQSELKRPAKKNWLAIVVVLFFVLAGTAFAIYYYWNNYYNKEEANDDLGMIENTAVLDYGEENLDLDNDLDNEEENLVENNENEDDADVYIGGMNVNENFDYPEEDQENVNKIEHYDSLPAERLKTEDEDTDLNLDGLTDLVKENLDNNTEESINNENINDSNDLGNIDTSIDERFNENSEENNVDANENTNEEINDAELDNDGDGLTNEEESLLGTDPNLVDTDGDTLSDRDEVFKYKTNPLSKDSDGDGYEDNVEIENGYDPNGPGKLEE